MSTFDSQFHLQVRKSPKQVRSRSTVDCIKQAARTLLIEEGFSNGTTTTTLIAERAGVSIGSLYQYFPTREAVFLALFEDTSIQITKTMKTTMVQILSLPLEKGVSTVLRQLLALHREHELVLLKLVTQIPELNLARQPLTFENMIIDSIRMYIDHFTPHLPSHDLHRRAFFLRATILGCIYRYLNEAPENVTDRAFIADLTQIVVSYINQQPRKIHENRSRTGNTKV